MFPLSIIVLLLMPAVRMKQCPYCGKIIRQDESDCRHCGRELPINMVQCPNCKKFVPEKPYCIECNRAL